jgi:sodium transport system permease protein
VSAWWVVAKKELRDSIRDRRTVVSLSLFPLVGPVLVSLMLSQVVHRATGDRRVEVFVVGRERAPGLAEHLATQGIVVVPAPSDPERAVKDGTIDVALVIAPDYAEKFRAGKPADVQIIMDGARERARASVRRVRAALHGYATTVGSLRLLARGQDPALTQPLRIDEIDSSTAAGRSSIFLGFVPMFALLAAFMGGMHTATDSTAGERERGSLEPLLLTPAPRLGLVIGKWLASVTLACASVLFTLACTLAALAQVPLERFGMTARIGVAQTALVLATILPVAPLICGLQLMVSTLARTVKEAQVYMSLLVFLPLGPGLWLSFEPMKTQLWMTLVPLLGQQSLLTEVVRGEPVSPLGFVIAALVAAALSVVCVLGTAALFRRERIAFPNN